MRTSWQIGSLFGIDIRIDSSWIVIFTFVTWALAKLTGRNVNQIPVLKAGKVEGILCRSDVRQFLQLRAELGA